jgi:hypothetical protein
LRNLLGSEIVGDFWGKHTAQQNQISSHRPVVDDAGTAALASRPNGYTNLAYPAATRDDSAELWIRSKPGLEFPILLIASKAVICLVISSTQDSIIRQWRIASEGKYVSMKLRCMMRWQKSPQLSSCA